MVEHLDKTGCTTGKVLATGIGNGGMLAHHWACQSDKVDGVVSVGGALQVPQCAEKRAIPVLMYHGTADTWMPLDGSGHHMTLEHSRKQWAVRNKSSLSVQTIADGPLNCRIHDGNADVGVCLVTGMKDYWPGAEDASLNEVSHPLKHASRGAFEWISKRW